MFIYVYITIDICIDLSYSVHTLRVERYETMTDSIKEAFSNARDNIKQMYLNAKDHIAEHGLADSFFKATMHAGITTAGVSLFTAVGSIPAIYLLSPSTEAFVQNSLVGLGCGLAGIFAGFFTPVAVAGGMDAYDSAKKLFKAPEPS